MEFRDEIDLDDGYLPVTVRAEYDDSLKWERSLTDEDCWWIIDVLNPQGEDVMSQLTRSELRRLERAAIDRAQRDYEEIFAPECSHPGNRYSY